MKILITGGASGLGRSIVEYLASFDKYSIYFTYNKSLAEAEQIEKTYSNCQKVFCNFSDISSVNDVLVKLDDIKPDVLINNACPEYKLEKFEKIESDDFVRSFSTNLLPTLMISRKCLSIFKAKKFGKIINILTSFVVNKPPLGNSKYIAEKNYLYSMSKSWSTEFIKFNITSNCISPSILETNFISSIDSRVIENIKGQHPLKEFLSVQDVAKTAEFIISSSQHLNGANIILNSGENVI